MDEWKQVSPNDVPMDHRMASSVEYGRRKDQSRVEEPPSTYSHTCFALTRRSSSSCANQPGRHADPMHNHPPRPSHTPIAFATAAFVIPRLCDRTLQHSSTSRCNPANHCCEKVAAEAMKAQVAPIKHEKWPVRACTSNLYGMETTNICGATALLSSRLS
jgi:hypothetical protein